MRRSRRAKSEPRHPEPADIIGWRPQTASNRRPLAVRALALAAGLLSAQRTVHAEQLPPDSGLVNVRDYGARGDGHADDTPAIRRAIAAAYIDNGKALWPERVVYFPAGTYRVTDTIDSRNASGFYRDAMALIGESRDTVRLVLDDHATGYARPDVAKAVVFTSSKLLNGPPTNGGKDYLGRGEGNDAYGNYVEDLTIDVGHDNPGAVAVDFLANNVGAIRNVNLVAPSGSGKLAISLDRKWPGPLIVRGAHVTGFGMGLSISNPEYTVTLADLILENQSRIGIRNAGNSVSLQNVAITTAATALQNTERTGLVVADRLTVRLLGAQAQWADNRGYLAVANVTIQGPAPAPRSDGFLHGQTGVYLANNRLPGFSASWAIPARTPPSPAPISPAFWANVVAYGAKPDPNVDSSEAIAAAFRAGAAVVYFPSGRYAVTEPIDVPEWVQRIAGMHSSITIAPKRATPFSRQVGILRIRTGGPPLIIDRLALDNTGRGGQVGLDHSGPRTVVLQDFITSGTDIWRRDSAGEMFLENACCGALHFAGPAGVWARQLDSEGLGTRVINDGSPLSILGLKVEQNCTAIENRAGARTEVLGGLIYQVKPPASPRPAFLNAYGADLTLSYTEEAYLNGSEYRDHVVQVTQSGSQATTRSVDLPKRGQLARIMPGMTFR